MHAEDSRLPLKDFVSAAGITLRAESCVDNPHMDGSENMDNWRCVLRAGRSRMTIYFSKGLGHKGAAPEAAEVLDCLASDAAGFENAQGFEDWCSEYGYDADSRRAERTFKTVERQAKRLRAFLGESAYETLPWKVDRQ